MGGGQVERDCILYINLCGLYPQDFLKYEVINYYGTSKYGDYLRNSLYRSSFINHLNTMTPLKALYFNQECFENATCFSSEQGKLGTTGHQRINCPEGNFSECCSYGMSTAKDIVMQLLIDHDVPSLGHRLICLSDQYSKIGVSVASHKVWESCAVLNFDW